MKFHGSRNGHVTCRASDRVSSEFDAQRSWHEQPISVINVATLVIGLRTVMYHSMHTINERVKPIRRKFSWTSSIATRISPKSRRQMGPGRSVVVLLGSCTGRSQGIRADPKHAYIKPEKTIDGLCKYCFFSFEEGLRQSDSDLSVRSLCSEEATTDVQTLLTDTW